jgi:hypothetical protein
LGWSCMLVTHQPNGASFKEMRPIRRPACFVIACLLGFLTAGSSLSATDDPELREILDKHWEAMGGMSNWSKVESIRLSGTVERDGQVVDIVIVKKRPNQIRATVTLPIPGDEENKLQIIRAHDGKKGWTARRLAGSKTMTQEELAPEAAAELLSDAVVLPRLIHLWQTNASLELRDPEIIKGNSCFAIHSRTEDGKEYTLFVSTSSFELRAFDSYGPNGAVTRTLLDDYVSRSGVKFPMKNTIDSPVTGRSVIVAESVEVGVGIYEEYFGVNESVSTAKSD